MVVNKGLKGCHLKMFLFLSRTYFNIERHFILSVLATLKNVF